MNQKVNNAIGGYEDCHPINSSYWTSGSDVHIPEYEMDKNLLRACEIIDRMRMRVMLPMDKHVTPKDINDFFKEVGYVTKIDRAIIRRRNPKLEDRAEAPSSVL